MAEENTEKLLVVSLDGPDGTGKTTQLELLKAHFEKKGLKVYSTRASGGTPFANELRKIVFSDLERGGDMELYVHFAMFTSLAIDLEKKSESYDVILIDRSPLSIFAYDAYAVGLEDLSEAYKGVERYFNDFNIDVLFYLDTKQEILNERLKSRAKTADYYEKQGQEFFQKVREGFDIALKHMKDLGSRTFEIYEIDASKSIEDIHSEITKELKYKI